MLRQLLTESLLLALPGGILGLGIAAAGIRFLTWLLAGGREDFSLRAELDWRVLAFTIAVAFATGILFGLAPAIAATRVDITPALKETRASAPGRRGHLIGLSQFLVVSQIALSLLLVLGAALFVRTLANLHSVEIGFNQESLLTFSLDASQAGYKDAALQAFYARMNERFRVLPGVRAATATDMPLVADGTSGPTLFCRVLPNMKAATAPSTSYISVGPTFFETMQHSDSARPVHRLARRGWRTLCRSGQRSLREDVFSRPESRSGGILRWQLRGRELTIVGIAKNARYNSLKARSRPSPTSLLAEHRQTSARLP